MLGVVITVVLGATCIIGLWNEDKLVAFENKIIEKFRNHKN